MTVSAVWMKPARYDIDNAITTGLVNLTFSFGSDNPTILKINSGEGESELLDRLSIVYQSSNDAIVQINLTEKWPPGRHHFALEVRETAPADRFGTVVALVGVEAPIYIDVPYPGKYLIGHLVVRAGNEGDPIYIDTIVSNRGYETISLASAVASILSTDGKEEIKQLPAHRTFSIKSGETVTFFHDWKNNTLKAGFYPLSVDVDYDEDILTLTDQVNIGEKDFDILNSTTNGIEHSIVPLTVEVKSLWANPIDQFTIRAKLKNENSSSPQSETPTLSLEPFEKKTVGTFIDASELSAGQYTLELIGVFRDLNRTKEFPFILSSKIEERKTLASTILTSTNILLLIIIILLIVLLLTKKTKKEAV